MIDEIHGFYFYASLAVIPTTKWFGIPNHFESSIYSREKVWALPNLFGSGIGMEIAEAVFQITELLPKKEDYGLTSQLRRAALSMSSIPTTKWFGTPNHFESSIYSREKVWALPNLFVSGIMLLKDLEDLGKKINPNFTNTLAAQDLKFVMI